MPRPRRTTAKPKEVIAIAHKDDSRRNNPTAEMEAVMDNSQRQPIPAIYERRNRNLDPQLVWRGKDEQDLSDLVVAAPPLFTQETVQPKVLVDDLMRVSKRRKMNGDKSEQPPLDLFANYHGPDDPNARTEFYEHDQHWTNRMILGDSLQVMASLAEREDLRGKVQCIYIDPPYGIRFNSNFQWSTTSRNVEDNNVAHITREPEQVKAFRDTWRDGIHSYLTYLRDRLTVARDLLHDSGSIFIQIGDENLHRVRVLVDEVFGEQNFIITIPFQKKAYQEATSLAPVNDYLIWAAKNSDALKFHPLYIPTPFEGDVGKHNRIESPTFEVQSSKNKEPEELEKLIEQGWRLVREDYPVHSQDPPAAPQPLTFQGVDYEPPRGRHWSQSWPTNMLRLAAAGRLRGTSRRLYARQYWNDSSITPRHNLWTQLKGPADPTYVVETTNTVVERCILMTTDPSDIVLDPTCGAGTTAHVAEQWGRRWITIDTSRVALALARARIMGARYPYYLLADSPEGQQKEAEIIRREIAEAPTHCNVQQGFVYQRIPHITLEDIAKNAEIDVIWNSHQERLEPLRGKLNTKLGQEWQEWEIPRHPDEHWSADTVQLHQDWWELRIARQKEIDASISANAGFQYLYDRPYTDNHKVRVSGPFTVESLSPHRILTSDDGDDGEVAETAPSHRYTGDVPERDFATLMLDNLRTSGVQQAQKAGKIDFVAITGWPGKYICADGTFMEGDDENAVERHAGIFIGPEFGTVTRANLTGAAREAAEAGFDVLIACAFSYDAHATDMDKLGIINVLKARMNSDLHMADTLKEDSKGNLFVVFGEPDIEVEDSGQDSNSTELISIKIHGVDIFNPATGQVQSDDTDGIACWFVDTDYNEESFFVRQAYFLGASNDPYKSLKTTLKAEIDEEAWNTLRRDTSRPFPKPESGRVAVKVINHLGDEAMKVITVR